MMNTAGPTTSSAKDIWRSRAGDIAILIENWIFPFLFGFSIVPHVRFLSIHATEIVHSLRDLLSDVPAVSSLTNSSAALTKILLIILNLLIIAGFLIRRNLKKKPETPQEIIVPLIGSFFYLMYNLLEHLPAGVNPTLFPSSWFPSLTLTGVLLNFIGAAIACLATYHLRYSYSLFVEVRDIVSRGPYRFVRHPIYCGYILSTIGLFFLSPRAGNLFFYCASILITVYRAGLEEQKLLAASAEYRDYAHRTPFLLPIRLFSQRPS